MTATEQPKRNDNLREVSGECYTRVANAGNVKGTIKNVTVAIEKDNLRSATANELNGASDKTTTLALIV